MRSWTLKNSNSLSPENALRRYLHQFLLPLVKRDRVSRYLRIFAWESVRPSEVFSAFVAHSPPRIFVLAERVVRRFLPRDASAETVTFAMLWLAQQPMFFVREAERLAQPPFSLKFDDDALERLVDTLAALSLRGLAGVRPFMTSPRRRVADLGANMDALLHSNYFAAVLTEAHKALELTQNFIILAATLALVGAFFALIKGA